VHTFNYTLSLTTANRVVFNPILTIYICHDVSALNVVHYIPYAYLLLSRYLRHVYDIIKTTYCNRPSINSIQFNPLKGSRWYLCYGSEKIKSLCLCRHPDGSAVAMLARSTLTQVIACCLGTLVGVYSAQALADLLLGIDSHIKYDAGMMVNALMLPLIFQVCSGVTLFGSRWL
jgi:hypothetical protein